MLGGQVANGIDPLDGLRQLLGQLVETVSDLAAVAGLALVEEGEAFGVLGS